MTLHRLHRGDYFMTERGDRAEYFIYLLGHEIADTHARTVHSITAKRALLHRWAARAAACSVFSCRHARRVIPLGTIPAVRAAVRVVVVIRSVVVVTCRYLLWLPRFVAAHEALMRAELPAHGWS